MVFCEQVVRTVSCGEHHAGAVSEVGVLYTWGRGAVEVGDVFGGGEYHMGLGYCGLVGYHCCHLHL